MNEFEREQQHGGACVRFRPKSGRTSLLTGASPGPGYVVESLVKSHAIIGVDQLLDARAAGGACRASVEDYPDLALGNDAAGG